MQHKVAGLKVASLAEGVAAQMMQRPLQECCPLWSGDGTPCGEATGRGLCRDIQISQAPYGPDQSLDENDVRTRWPRAFYNRTCTCTGNFYGPDCGECWFGWEDPSCLKRRELTRRNVLSLSAMDRSRLMAYINLAKVTVNPTYCILVTPPGPNGSLPIFANASYYDVFVWMHYFASQRKDDSTGPDYAHEGAGFLPWHRLFLLSWERALQRVSGDLTLSLPYWDWRDAENCQVCTDDLFGAYRPSESGSISSGSIFAAWQITCTRDAEYASQGMFCAGKGEGPLERRPGNHDRFHSLRLPSSQDVNYCLNMPEYDVFPFDRHANGSFRNLLEGFADPQNGHASNLSTMHNAVHIFMNGSMSSVGSSANDPLFIVHHTFTDSIFEVWLFRHNANEMVLPSQGATVGHNREDFMVPFFPLVRQSEGMLPANTFGYSYDISNNQSEFWDILFPSLLSSAQQAWPWIICSSIIGSAISLAVCGIVKRVFQKYRAKHNAPDELQPFLPKEELIYQQTIQASFIAFANAKWRISE
uniref:tyrosinase isoform X3 n=1 Tax=Myxine glutinosa TaxID=7769 RepID=UPI00358FD084